jgi:gluconate 5-dehydrogenase
VLETNLTAPFLVAQSVGPGMVKRKSGKIINICSLTSELWRGNIAPYTTEKGDLRMLTKLMAVECVKDNVLVNGIGPGYFWQK